MIRSPYTDKNVSLSEQSILAILKFIHRSDPTKYSLVTSSLTFWLNVTMSLNEVEVSSNDITMSSNDITTFGFETPPNPFTFDTPETDTMHDHGENLFVGPKRIIRLCVHTRQNTIPEPYPEFHLKVFQRSTLDGVEDYYWRNSLTFREEELFAITETTRDLDNFLERAYGERREKYTHRNLSAKRLMTKYALTCKEVYIPRKKKKSRISAERAKIARNKEHSTDEETVAISRLNVSEEPSTSGSQR